MIDFLSQTIDKNIKKAYTPPHEQDILDDLLIKFQYLTFFGFMYIIHTLTVKREWWNWQTR